MAWEYMIPADMPYPGDGFPVEVETLSEMVFDMGMGRSVMKEDFLGAVVKALRALAGFQRDEKQELEDKVSGLEEELEEAKEAAEKAKEELEANEEKILDLRAEAREEGIAEGRRQAFAEMKA